MTDKILFDELVGDHGRIGQITLNRTQALNALTHEMILALDQQLYTWEKNSQVKAVIITSSSNKAFCAGGDIRQLYDAKKNNDPNLSQFFWDEYRLNHHIHHYTKPYIALMNGLTMGGGVGISLHGSHRVATENFAFAMPETAIGFFPDIGASYLLSRLPGELGLYLGLTGTRINAADTYYAKLVNHYLPSHQLEKLVAALLQTNLANNEIISQLITEFAEPTQSPALVQKLELINAAFRFNTIDEIITHLQNTANEWSNQVATDLLKKSPTSLKVTLKQIRAAKQLSFDDCIKMDYRIVNRMLQGHDFFEGIRALLVDKDKAPHWQPKALSTVDSDDITRYFEPLNLKELQL